MSACLVTGATGFIGGHVARRLAAEGRAVRALARATSDTSALQGTGAEVVVGDLTDPDSLARAAAGCGAVVHCAALVSDWATVAEVRRVNVEGTRNLLAALDPGARLVHVSTTDVYGYPGTPGVDETHVADRFRNWYAQTKLEAEAEVRRAAPGAVVLRPATVYGPGSVDVVGEIAAALRGGHMLLVGGGRAVAGLCFVDNLADLVLCALEHDAARGGAFNATDGLDVTWRRFISDLAAGLGCRPPRWSLPYPAAAAIGAGLEHGYRALRRATGVTLPPLLSRQAVHVLGIDQDFSNRRAREVLGWEPRVSYAEGMEATLAWLRRPS